MTHQRPAWAERSDLERDYYDTEWGLPVTSERGVFERLSLEVFQSGLSWTTILARREAFRVAFAGFDPDAVSEFTEDDVTRLVADETIIRNRRKIVATIENARAVRELRRDPELRGRGPIESGLPALVWSYRPAEHPLYEERDMPAESPQSQALARELKSRGFSHLGPVTVYAMMQAIGIVNDHPAGSWRREPVALAVADVVRAAT